MNLTELKFDLTRLKAQLLLAKGNWSHKGRPGMRGGSGGGKTIFTSYYIRTKKWISLRTVPCNRPNRDRRYKRKGSVN